MSKSMTFLRTPQLKRRWSIQLHTHPWQTRTPSSLSLVAQTSTTTSALTVATQIPSGHQVGPSYHPHTPTSSSMQSASPSSSVSNAQVYTEASACTSGTSQHYPILHHFHVPSHQLREIRLDGHLADRSGQTHAGSLPVHTQIHPRYTSPHSSAEMPHSNTSFSPTLPPIKAVTQTAWPHMPSIIPGQPLNTAKRCVVPSPSSCFPLTPFP